MFLLPTEYSDYPHWRKVWDSHPEWRKQDAKERISLFQRDCLEKSGVSFSRKTYVEATLPSGWSVKPEGDYKILLDGDNKVRAKIYSNSVSEKMEVFPRFSISKKIEDTYDGGVSVSVYILDGGSPAKGVSLYISKDDKESDVSWSAYEDQIRTLVSGFEEFLSAFFPKWWDPSLYWGDPIPDSWALENKK